MLAVTVVYFVAYALGLGATFLALVLMTTAQPALLYLVPFTLLTTFSVALLRGEFRHCWLGKAPSPAMATPAEATESSDEGKPMLD